MSAAGLAPVLASLQAIGFHADPEWVEANRTMAGLPDDVAQKLLAIATHCDLRRIVSTGSLPTIDPTVLTSLQGPFFLQIDSCEDVSIPLEDRAGGLNSVNRALKFQLSDGRQEIFAFEHRRLAAVPSIVTKGAKLLVKNVEVRHRLLLLSADNTLFLGGDFESEPPAPA
jgi:hypothetical protein